MKDKEKLRNSIIQFADVSVIIPVFNRNKILLETLESVYKQSVLPKEVIIVDDCSDEPVKVPDKPGQKVLRLEKNVGPGGARNRGAELASQKLLFFLDSDDILLTEAIRFHVDFVNNNPVQGAWCNVLSTHGKIIIGRSPLPESDNPLIAMLRRNFIHSVSGFSILRSTFQSMGGFREDIRICEDYDFYVRLLSKPNIQLVEIGLFLVHRRIMGGNLTSNIVEWAENLFRLYGDLISNPNLKEYLPYLQYGFERRLRRLLLKSSSTDKKSIDLLLNKICDIGKLNHTQMISLPEPIPRFIQIITKNGLPKDKGTIILNLDYSSISSVSPRLHSSLAHNIADWASEKKINVLCIPVNTELGNDDRLPLSLFALVAKTPVRILSRPPRKQLIQEIFADADAVVTTNKSFAESAESNNISTCLLQPSADYLLNRELLNDLSAKILMK